MLITIGAERVNDFCKIQGSTELENVFKLSCCSNVFKLSCCSNVFKLSWPSVAKHTY